MAASISPPDHQLIENGTYKPVSDDASMVRMQVSGVNRSNEQLRDARVVGRWRGLTTDIAAYPAPRRVHGRGGASAEYRICHDRPWSITGPTRLDISRDQKAELVLDLGMPAEDVDLAQLLLTGITWTDRYGDAWV